MEAQRNKQPDWVKDAIFYQIFPERFKNGDLSNDPFDIASWGDVPTRDNFFGGDIAGIQQELDYLQEMGINAIYLNPIFKAKTNHRYDTSDYFEIDPVLGNLDTMRSFVQEIHERGMHIILDGVFNHCGNGFAPFVDLCENGSLSHFQDWFQYQELPIQTNPVNYLSCGGCTYLPKLNHGNEEVQKFILKVACYWLQTLDMDGWRLDVPFKIPYEFWRKFRNEVKNINPNAYLVGEVWREAGPWIQGDIFDGVTNYRLRDIVFDYVDTKILDAEDFGYELQTLIESHGYAAGSMLNLLDSHDTERIMTTFKGNTKKLRIAYAIMMTLPGAPMIYYGDEMGLFGGNDPDCRRCFPWNEDEQNRNIYEYVKQIIQLRKDHSCLRYGSPKNLAYFNGVFAYKQSYEEDEVIIITNPREEIRNLQIPTESKKEQWTCYFSNDVVRSENGFLSIRSIAAEDIVILIGG